MADKRFRGRDKIVQKMTKDGLVEENLRTGETKSAVAKEPPKQEDSEKTLRKVQKKPLLWKRMCAWMPRMERRKSPGAAPPSRVQSIIKPIRRMENRKKKMFRQWTRI